ncbi:MAG TPA: hypothetical protein VLW26_05340 [Steroidobacteraceae bacterium]|nr:hypothetical protein [Steroidobacteraceae bacterium]
MSEIPLSRTMLTLVRREFWEHRALWIAPLIVAGLLLIGASFGNISAGNAAEGARAMASGFAGIAMWGFNLVQMVVLSIVMWFYLTDCLYTERKDRSILFWKSLPVNDTQTVLSKALVAIIAMPLLVILVSTATNLLVCVIWSVRAGSLAAAGKVWDPQVLLAVESHLVVSNLIIALWVAPVTAYLLLVSAWARRNVQLWAILPPVLLILIEWLGFRTHYVWTILWYRMGGWWQGRTANAFFDGDQMMHMANSSSPSLDFLNAMHMSVVLTNPDLYIGFAVAALLLAATIRIRRYRDDT